MREQLRINLNIGAGCFVKCLGCYNHFGKDFVNCEVIINFLTYLKQYDVNHVTLGGGDPLTYPNILKLLEQIKSLGYRINLDTVGTPLLADSASVFFKRVHVQKIDPQRLAELVDLIGIPIDGTNSETINKFRELRPNIFNEQMQILELLNNSNANVCINTVVHQHNVEDLENITYHIPKHLYSKWQFFQYMPIGPLGFKNRGRYLISEKSFTEFETKIRSIVSEQELHKFDFKKASSRKGNYLFVDSSGEIWVPKVSLSEYWSDEHDVTNQRYILGNINNKSDYTSILNVVKNPKIHLDNVEQERIIV